MDFVLAKSEIEAVVNCDPGAVERVLKLVKVKLEKYIERQSQRSRYITQCIVQYVANTCY